MDVKNLNYITNMYQFTIKTKNACMTMYSHSFPNFHFFSEAKSSSNVFRNPVNRKISFSNIRLRLEIVVKT